MSWRVAFVIWLLSIASSVGSACCACWQKVLLGKLSLIDLAGSERASQTDNRGAVIAFTALH
eukprot:1137227-Amphidinium_carterae.1